MPTARPVALSENYYLANFHRLAAFVRDTYGDILEPAERLWYESVTDTSESAQRLYIRLLTRKGSVFRLSRLDYPEIGDLQPAACELASQGLADIAPPESLADLIRTFTKPELLELLPIPVTGSLPRADLVEQVLSSERAVCAAHTQILQQADSWITLAGHQYWTIYRLSFFGNLYQDSSEFVLSELGTVQYESYPLDASARAFVSRHQLEAHLRYFECESLLDTIDFRDAQQLSALVECLPAPITGDDHLQRRIDRFRNRIARQLERLGHQSAALELYAASAHPPARERRVRIHLASEDPVSAGQLLELMRENPFNDAEAQVADRLQRKLDRAIGRATPVRNRYRPDITTLTLKAADERVELAACRFYSRFGVCQYSENSLVCAVLGLFIWDIVFHPVEGVFFNPFQSAPADFHEPAFSTRRHDLLCARFAELRQSSTFHDRVMKACTLHRGKANPLVRWGRVSDELLTLALQRIPVDHWQAMFQRILADTRENTSGFPDLVLFRDTGDYEFIEIKGPGDVLQQNQLRWMHYFSEHRIPCRVVNIRWPQCTSSRIDT
ncbi:MAG: VRR-NUC domain-containing protein [Granulosicoccus sp.]|nr:VRR-NUC domain-containing protein [Granulosicoccus sp.]